MRFDGDALKNVSSELKRDREVVLTAVRNDMFDGDALKHVSSELKRDREVVLTAVRNDVGGKALQYADDQLKNDPQIVLAAVKASHGDALQYASDELKNDRQFILRITPLLPAFQYAGKEPRSDRVVVLAAVQEVRCDERSNPAESAKKLQVCKDALDFAELWDDREIVLNMVHIKGKYLAHASGKLRKDRALVLAAVAQKWAAWQYADEGLWKDSIFVLAMTRMNARAFLHPPAQEWHREDREIVMAAVKQDGALLKFTHNNLKKDRDVVRAAVQQAPTALKYAHDELLKDREFVLSMMQRPCHERKVTSGPAPRTIMISAMQADTLSFADPDLRANVEFLLECMRDVSGKPVHLTPEHVTLLESSCRAREQAIKNQEAEVRQRDERLAKARSDFRRAKDIIIKYQKRTPRQQQAQQHAEAELRKRDMELAEAKEREQAIVLQRNLAETELTSWRNGSKRLVAEVIDVEHETISSEAVPCNERLEVGRKRPFEGASAGSSSSTARIVRIKEEMNDFEDDLKTQTLFTDHLHTKIDELKAIAEAAGADRHRLQEIIARPYV